MKEIHHGFAQLKLLNDTEEDVKISNFFLMQNLRHLREKKDLHGPTTFPELIVTKKKKKEENHNSPRAGGESLVSENT